MVLRPALLALPDAPQQFAPNVLVPIKECPATPPNRSSAESGTTTSTGTSSVPVTPPNGIRTRSRTTVSSSSVSFSDIADHRSSRSTTSSGAAGLSGRTQTSDNLSTSHYNFTGDEISSATGCHYCLLSNGKRVHNLTPSYRPLPEEPQSHFSDNSSEDDDVDALAGTFSKIAALRRRRATARSSRSAHTTTTISEDATNDSDEGDENADDGASVRTAATTFSRFVAHARARSNARNSRTSSMRSGKFKHTHTRLADLFAAAATASSSPGGAGYGGTITPLTARSGAGADDSALLSDTTEGASERAEEKQNGGGEAAWPAVATARPISAPTPELRRRDREVAIIEGLPVRPVTLSEPLHEGGGGAGRF